MDTGSFVPTNFGEAEERLRAASFGAWALAVVNLLGALVVDEPMYQVADGVFVVVLAIGISLRSRWGVVAMALYYALATVMILVEGALGGVIFKVLIIAFFVRAAVAAFKYHQYKPAEATWLPIARILFIIASLALPILAIVGLFLGAFFGELEGGSGYKDADDVEIVIAPLEVERMGWETKVTPPPGRERLPIPAPPEDSGLTKVSYPSAVGDLAGYLSTSPTAEELGETKVPAIVWAVGGFDGIGDFVWTPSPATNDQSVLPMLGQGVVVFAPSWRGQGDNPGEMELFYGEVDDLLAAVAFIKQDPRVDPDRVWIAGHSTGGTMTLLAAELGHTFRGAVALGPWPDMVWAHQSDPLGYIPWPYAEAGGRDDELRSPVRHIGSVTRPTLVVMAQEDVQKDMRVFKQLAERKSPHLGVLFIGGDHFNTVRPVQEALVEMVKADTGKGRLLIPTDGLLAKTEGLTWEGQQ